VTRRVFGQFLSESNNENVMKISVSYGILLSYLSFYFNHLTSAKALLLLALRMLYN